MKRILLCGYDEAMKELGDLTAPLQQAYASKHGYDFKCHRIYSRDVMAYWEKLYFVRDALNEYEEVHWVDSDIVITNPNRFFQTEKAGLHVSRDWGVDAVGPYDFSSCHFVATKEAALFFDFAILKEQWWLKERLYDQDALREVIASYLKGKNLIRADRPDLATDADLIYIHPRRTFNSVPIEVHESTPEPWQPGDFCAHLTMIRGAERVALFHKIMERIR
jgi:hypothetical protein